MTAPSPVTKPRRVQPDTDGPISVADARDRYRGEWVLMRIFEFDEHHRPARGYILRHSRSRKAISNRLAKEPPRSQLPKHERFYIFHASPLITSGPATEEGVRKFLGGLFSALGAQSASGRE